MGLPEIFRGIARRSAMPEETRNAFRKSILNQLRPHIVSSPELARIISPLNFRLMQQLLSEDVRRSAHGAKKPESIIADGISKREIIFTNDEGYVAMGADPSHVLVYVPLSHLLIINVPRVFEEAKDNPDIPFQLLVVNALMHEQVHASSSRFAKAEGDYLTVQSGYQQAVTNRDGTHSVRLYELLNEAVNESRAIELTRAYIKASPIPGVTHEHLDRLADIYRYKHTSTEYFVAMHLLNEMIKKLAADTGVSEDVVRKGFTQGEVAGLWLDNKEARIALDFDSVFGRGFTKELGTIGEDNLIEFLRKYKINMGSEFMRAARRYGEFAIEAYTRTHGVAPGQSLPGLPTSGTKRD